MLGAFKEILNAIVKQSNSWSAIALNRLERNQNDIKFLYLHSYINKCVILKFTLHAIALIWVNKITFLAGGKKMFVHILFLLRPTHCKMNIKVNNSFLKITGHN